AVTEQSSSATQQVSAAAQEQNASVEEMTASSKSVAELADRTRQLMEQFQVSNTDAAHTAKPASRKASGRGNIANVA
ncbi:MAG: hypothetical protein ACYC6A_16085, partial [Armatimonadota bacterium]